MSGCQEQRCPNATGNGDVHFVVPAGSRAGSPAGNRSRQLAGSRAGGTTLWPMDIEMIEARVKDRAYDVVEALEFDVMLVAFNVLWNDQ